MFRLFLILLASAIALPHAALAQNAKKRILAIGQSKGYQHDAVSHALATVWKMGQETGLWDTFIRTDTQLITKKKLADNAKNLDYFDAVLFYTTGELDMDASQKADLLNFIREEGKGFIGVHSALDTFYQWPEYGEMIGGYFDHHPWNTFQAPIVNEDPTNPIVQHLPKELRVYDEIYQARNFSRDKVRVLLALDPNQIDLTNKYIHRTDKDFAVAWLRTYGKGRVFYSTLGHTESTWNRPDTQKMYLEAIKWALNLTQIPQTTPKPKP